MLQIAGLQKLSMVDYPDKLAATVFMKGCNLRCPFCHNPSLVVPNQFSSQGNVPFSEIITFLEARVGKLDAVVISGGEPLAQDTATLIYLISVIDSINHYKIKLDTNGTFPNALQMVLDTGMIDYVAMDIKNAPMKCAETAGNLPKISNDAIAALYHRSITILRNHKKTHPGFEYEFRTTIMKELHTVEDLQSIGSFLGGFTIKNENGPCSYYLQNFVDHENLVSSSQFTGFSEDEIKQLQLDIQSSFKCPVYIRGV